MSMASKIIRLADDKSVRTHISGFHIPDFSKERYDADPLTAHLAIKYLRDLIDADHCAYIFDKNHELEDLGYLEEIKAMDAARRKEELIEFKSKHLTWEKEMGALLEAWTQQANIIEAMDPGDEKEAAITNYVAAQENIIGTHPEPKHPKFEPILLPTEATQLAAREVENKKRKDDADKCMARFKALAGPTITSDLSRTWDDPTIPSIDKARISYDYFLQCQHVDADSTVARLTADMNALQPATSVQGGLLLYQKMNIIQETLTKIGPQYALAESVLVATIRTKLQGDAFDNLKFFHKQTDGHTRPVVRAAALFGTPTPARATEKHVSWTQLGTNLLELSETKSAATTSCLDSHALVCTQEESVALYARQQQQPHRQYNHYPPPQSYQPPQRRNFVPVSGPPAWLGQSRPFQNLVQPRPYNIPAGMAQTPYAGFLHAHQQQQQMASAKTGGHPPRPPGPNTAGRGVPSAPSTHGVKRSSVGAPIGGSSTSRPPLMPVYGPGGDLRCYLAQDDPDDANPAMSQDQLVEDGVAGVLATAPTSDGTSSAFAVQEVETPMQPMQAPYYVDEYGQIHYLG